MQNSDEIKTALERMGSEAKAAARKLATATTAGKNSWLNAMADAIYSICHNEGLFNYLQQKGQEEVAQITWEKVGRWIRELYLRTLHWI